MRSVTRVVAVTLAGLAACSEPTITPSGGGALSLIMPASRGATLDSGHVIVSGPTTKTVTAAPGASVTIDGLAPGTYTVALEGFIGGGVGYYTQVTGVSVVAGQNTSATATALAVFQPSIRSMPAYTVTAQFALVYSKVP